MAESTPRGKPEPQSFSDGVDRLLVRVRPHGRPETAFPEALNVTETRRTSSESLHDWFVRMIDRYCGGDPTDVGVEENIAIIAKLKWEKDRLIYASVQTLVAECTLEEYYCDSDAIAVYFRLDLNYETLGEAFSHPLAHIHVGDEESPRFSLDGGISGNVIMDYLEFIYRNHKPRQWVLWARRQWLSALDDDAHADQFNQIVRAFRDSQFNVLRAHAHVISQIKRTLREAKDSLFKAHMDGADREILEYPLAR